MKASHPLSTLRANAMLSWKLPLLGLGAALIAIIWIGIWLQVDTERRAMIKSMTQETANLALVIEQNTERTASEIDRILLYLRSTYERQGHIADWPTLVQEEFAASNRTVQIAVMDERGMMLTSSKMLYPKTPVDLSDREHFRVHMNSKVDQLFISLPVLGRASNKWSVQFTRPYHKIDGSFAGVLVVSLDPEFLTRNFAALNLGADGGLAIVGDDGIVRAGAGRYETALGKSLSAGPAPARLISRQNTPTEEFDDKTGAPRVTAYRTLKDFPLLAVVSRSDDPLYRTWQRNLKTYVTGGTIVTIAVLLALATSIRRRKGYEKQLNHLARHDALTNLLNRREFSACLTERLKDRRKPFGFSLHLLDLDGFKRVNDTYGHPVGDELLVMAGQRLVTNLRSSDVIARLGGDEFAVIQAHDGNELAAASLAERICAILSEPYEIGGKRIEVGASIGIVIDCERFSDEDHLMRSADLALYAAKSGGGGAHCIYTERMNEEAEARREIELGLRAAIAHDELEVHYQPIYGLPGLEMTGAEALVRWRHPDKGMISPGVFIPVAEQSGLIVEIGAWVLKKACTEIAARSPSITIAVNVSAIEFRDGDVAGTVHTTLTETGIAPHRLKIEITESLLMKKDRNTIDQLDQLRKMGVRIAMDDFGTGYSSLSYLQSYPIDCIKIDQSFVRNISTVGSSIAIIEAIARLATAMGMTTVAEGVETEEQLAALKAVGCDAAQGFLLSRPKRIDDIAGLSPPVDESATMLTPTRMSAA